MKSLLLYVPVIHSGFEELLSRERFYDSDTYVYVLGRSFSDRYPSLRKDVRALEPDHAVNYLRAGFPHLRASVIETAHLENPAFKGRLHVPRDPLLREIVRDYNLADKNVIVWVEKTFLRWDRTRSRQRFLPEPDVAITSSEAERLLAVSAQQLGAESSDWWRHVGALAVRDGSVLARAHNRHLPTDYTPYIDGDPRAEFRRGIRADLGTALHAEAGVVAQCARVGLHLAGADIVASTFPCPACAKLIVAAGFRRCLYTEGYAMLDGVSVMRSAGVQVIRVDTDPTPNPQLPLYTV